MASNQIFSANPALFRSKGTIGKGQFGTVYKVQDLVGNEYAVKEIDLSKYTEGKDRQRALDQVSTMKSLDKNRNVVRLYHHLQDGDVLLIAMELCEEGSLKDALDRKVKRNEWFEEDILIHWLAQLVNVLQYCHALKILHHDIKPENILLADNGRTVKLNDFVIATVLQGDEEYDETLIGTLAYLPPEMFRTGTYHYRSEVWALGVVMYQLMAKQMPHSGNFAMVVIELLDENNVKPLPDCRYSEDLRHCVVEQMLRKNIDERATMNELSDVPFLSKEISRLPKKKADYSLLTKKDRKSGSRMLHHAANEGHAETCQKLVSYGADVYAKSSDEEGDMPLAFLHAGGQSRRKTDDFVRDRQSQCLGFDLI